MREQLECVELCLGMEEKSSENLWVRIKERTGKDDIIVGVYKVFYRLLDKEECG